MKALVTLLIALASAGPASPVTAPSRPVCRTVPAGGGAFARVTLPVSVAAEDVWLTRNGRNIDRDGDGWGMVGSYVVSGIADDLRRRTRVYVSVFRWDRRAGRFCFSVRWRPYRGP